MEVVSLRASQLTQQIYSSSVRLFFSSQQQQQQQLLAFCTILTVALSFLLYSRRHYHLNYHLNYHYANLSRCLNCLLIRPSRIRPQINLKLKRLRTLTSATKSTTVYYTSCLLRPLNRMRKETKIRVKNIINIKSGMSSAASFYSLKRTNSTTTAAAAVAAVNSTQSLYYPKCDQTCTANMTTSKSYPMFVPPTNTAGGRRIFTQPRINSSKVHLYRKLPLRSMSRAWGEINSIDLPTWCRKPCYYFYSWMFSCNLEEIDIDDLTQYKNLSEFFRRALKPDARSIHPSTLVSPCDGKILHFGKVDKGMLEQVKGVNYALQAFLGDQTWPKNDVTRTSSPSRYSLSSSSSDDERISVGSQDSGISDSSSAEMVDEAYEKSILYHPDENCLYHCIIYLAPGDYHRFHSPTDWQIFARRHFPGELFSVNPSVARWLQGLFNFNERVVYYGEWQHGFFSMTAVGATNVGSIRVYMDDGLTTNKKQPKTSNLDNKSDLEKNFSKYDTQSDSIKGVEIKKGENFGEFNLGSTIVLIFEAPKDFKFTVNQSEKVFFGCQLGTSSSYPERDEHTKL